MSDTTQSNDILAVQMEKNIEEIHISGFGKAEKYEGRTSITKDQDFHIPETPTGVLRLDIACGQNKKFGYQGVDITPMDGVDFVVDLTKFPWPFADNSVYEIHCSHYVEHTPDLIAFMDECYRILCPGGTIDIHAPYYSSIRAWQDPTHVRAISEATFTYFTKVGRDGMNLTHYPIKSDFEIINTIMIFNPEYEPKAEEAKIWALRHYINVVDDIRVVMRKK